MKNIIIFIFVASVVVLFIHFNTTKKTKYLEMYAKPFQEACKKGACIIKPEGWSKFDKFSFYDKSAMHPISYKATDNEFEMTWKISTGVTLIATGGKLNNLIIEKKVD